MTAEQLEELLKDAYTPGYRNRFRELQNMAPSLARRLIAAEKLVEALDQCLGEMTGNMDGDLREDRDGRDMARDALTAYREASK